MSNIIAVHNLMITAVAELEPVEGGFRVHIKQPHINGNTQVIADMPEAVANKVHELLRYGILKQLGAEAKLPANTEASVIEPDGVPKIQVN